MGLGTGIEVLMVLGLAVLSMAIGYVWYEPLFGEQWRELSGVPKKKVRKSSKAKSKKVKDAEKRICMNYVYGFGVSLVMLFILLYLVKVSRVGAVVEGMFLGILVWIGFVATTGLHSVLWEKKNWKLYLINASYYLVVLMISGGVLAACNPLVFF